MRCINKKGGKRTWQKAMDKTDTELLAQYRHGQVNALERLIKKYRRPLFGFILNMTEGRDDADEIFQEVWFRVIRKIGIYRHKNFFGWLVRIAHNIIIDRARRAKPDVSLDDERGESQSLAQVIAGNDPGPLRRVAANELGRNIAKAVAGLPMNQKEVFLMRVQAGLSFKEVALIQGVSINTALARMQYALAKLRPALQEEYQDR